MRYKLIETASGKEVKPGMTILDHHNHIWKLQGVWPPRSASSTGRVIVQDTDNLNEVCEFYPSVFGLQIVEAPDGPFDN